MKIPHWFSLGFTREFVFIEVLSPGIGGNHRDVHCSILIPNSMVVKSSLECYPREFNEGFILDLRCDRMCSSVWQLPEALGMPHPHHCSHGVCVCQDQVKQKQTVTQVLTFAGDWLSAAPVYRHGLCPVNWSNSMVAVRFLSCMLSDDFSSFRMWCVSLCPCFVPVKTFKLTTFSTTYLSSV